MTKVWILLIEMGSAFFRVLGGSVCRFYPSCSRYSIEAFRHFCFWTALRLMVGRLSRCHPLLPGGYDPLPSPAKGKKQS